MAISELIGSSPKFRVVLNDIDMVAAAGCAGRIGLWPSIRTLRPRTRRLHRDGYSGHGTLSIRRSRHAFPGRNRNLPLELQPKLLRVLQENNNSSAWTEAAPYKWMYG
jgi:hypothetical protein